MKVNLDWQFSNCCDAAFVKLGDHVTDICSKCGEHADIIEVWMQMLNPFHIYLISSFGKFESIYYNRFSGEKYYKPLVCSSFSHNNKEKGYPTVKLFINEQKYLRRLVHRMVALHFVPNPLNLPIVNHEDLNKQNPKSNNLQWCTHAANTLHYLYKHFKKEK
jgi:hypothetical protein